MQNTEVRKSSSPKIRIKLDKLPKTISGIWKLPKDKQQIENIYSWKTTRPSGKAVGVSRFPTLT